MKRFSGLVAIMVGTVLCAHAEVRSWSSSSGQTIEGEYVSVVFDNVVIKDAQGKEIKVPLELLSKADQEYVQLQNPPRLQIDYDDYGTTPEEITADPWESNSGGMNLNHPVYFINARFGARVKQASSGVYTLPMTIEMYVFTRQYMDPDKLHLIAHKRSPQFTLTKENGRKFEWLDKTKHLIVYHNLQSQWPRGEVLRKDYLILVRDMAGNIVDYNASGEWMYKYYDRLKELPVGAWLNNKAERVHTTQPQRGQDGPP